MGHVSALDPLTAGTEDCLVERGSSARQEKKMHRLIKNNFLTCMFCFPISDHVIVPQRTISTRI